MEVSGQPHASAALSPGKESRYPLYSRLCWPQSRSGRGGEEKIPSLRLPEIEPWSSNPYPSQCTDWATAKILSEL
jgi:hypothetical protein